MAKDARRGQEIVYDLTPGHRNRTTGVHGLGSGTVVGSNVFDDYKEEQRKKLALYSSIIKCLLKTLWDDIDWDEIDLEEIDWDEWE